MSSSGSRAADEAPRRPTATEPVDEKVVYSPVSELRDAGGLVRRIAADFLAGRELAWRLFQRNLRGSYRQTALGMAWVFLPPLANALLWIFLHRQKVLAFEAPRGVPYPLFVLTGMVIWQSFVDALQMPLMVVKQNRAMVTKLHFPREALLMVGWLEVGWNGLARCLVLFLLAAWYGVPWSGSAWLFPVGWLGLVVLGTAIGLWILPLGTLYQDVEKLLVLGLPLWMIVTPIIYPVSELGTDHWLVALNPAAGLVVMARDGLVAGEGSLAGWAVLYGGAAIPLLLGGLLLYRLSLPVLIERMPS